MTADAARLVRRIGERARAAPNAPAVTGTRWTLRLRELEERSDALAERLRELIPARSVVGLRFGRTVESVIALLGALKAGASVVSIDPSDSDALGKAIHDRGIAALLTELALESPTVDFPVVVIDGGDLPARPRAPLGERPVTTSPVRLGANDEEAVFGERIEAADGAASLTCDDIVVVCLPWRAVREGGGLLSMLAAGCHLVFAEADDGPWHVSALIDREEATVVALEASVLESLLAQAQGGRRCRSLRRILVVPGSPIPEDIRELSSARLPAVELSPWGLDPLAPARAGIDVLPSAPPQSSKGFGVGYPALPRRPDEVRAPMSFAQTIVWRELGRPTAVSVRSWVLHLRGVVLSTSAIERALNGVADRHEAWRTGFVSTPAGPELRIGRTARVALKCIDESGTAPLERRSRLRARVESLAARPFDLARPPLLRAVHFRYGRDEHAVAIVAHALIDDTRSAELVRDELAVSLMQGSSPGPAAVLNRLGDYTTWERGEGGALKRADDLAYWTRMLAAPPPALRFVAPEQPVSGSKPAPLVSTLAAASAQSVCAAGFPLAAVVPACLGALLARDAASRDMILAVVSDGRPGPASGDLLGRFLRLVPLRLSVDRQEPIAELLVRTVRALADAEAHVAIDEAALAAMIGADAGMASLPVVVEVRNTMTWPTRGDARLRLELLEGVFPAAALALFVEQSEDGSLVFRWTHDSERVAVDDVIQLDRRLRRLLAAIPGQGSTAIAELDHSLRGAERSWLVDGFNATVRDYDFVAVHDRFLEHALRAPDAVAISFDGASTTYGELDRMTAAIAERLQALGIGRGDVVGLLFERSVEMVAAVVAVLRCGAAYLPVDPEYPAARIEMVLADARAGAILTVERFASRAGSGRPLVTLDGVEAPRRPRGTLRDVAVGPSDAAYVIFTSGSTGRPKGVVNTHGGIHNRLLWNQAVLPLTPNDRFLLKTIYTFDMSVPEFHLPLISGGRIVLARPEAYSEPDYLIDLIEREGVTVANFVPSLLQLFVDAVERAGCCASLRRIEAIGEALPPSLCETFYSKLGAELWNLYGPTEAAVAVTSWAVPRTSLDRVPIGRPMHNTQLYVVNEKLDLLPPGMAGELCIAGANLARGYVGQPGLTAERFVPCPFRPGERMYRTGDLVTLRYGELDYLGRIDGQVKIRGVRIETDEVASALRALDGVLDARVVVRPDAAGKPSLVAYVIADPTAARRRVVRAEAALRDIVAARNDVDPMFDTTGWFSALTGRGLDRAALEDLLRGTAGLILANRPERVLEIGCGRGLISLLVAPNAVSYLAVDDDPAAIGHLSSVGARIEGFSAQIASPAASFAMGAQPDVVVLNRVTRRLNTALELESLLDQSRGRLAPHGRIVVAGVRDLRLLEAYLLENEMAWSGTGRSLAELVARLPVQVAARDELWVHPAWFAIWARNRGWVAEVHVAHGRAEHDHTRFCYDVVLAVAPSLLPARIELAPDSDAAAIAVALECSDGKDIILRGAVDPRVVRAVRALQAIPRLPGNATVAMLSTSEDAVPAESILDPDALRTIAAVAGRRAIVSPAATPGQLDVLFTAGIEVRSWPDGRLTGNPRELAPSIGVLEIEASTIQRWNEQLRDILPRTYLPTAYVAVDEYPTTANGKLDVRALPEASVDLSGGGRGAMSSAQRYLIEVWERVLGRTGICVDDDFFIVGGHSLTALQMLNDVRDALSVSIPLHTFFTSPTVESMIDFIASEWGADAKLVDDAVDAMG